jgi:hypothetical protein
MAVVYQDEAADERRVGGGTLIIAEARGSVRMAVAYQDEATDERRVGGSEHHADQPAKRHAHHCEGVGGEGLQHVRLPRVDEMGWDGMGWDRMGWDQIRSGMTYACTANDRARGREQSTTARQHDSTACGSDRARQHDSTAQSSQVYRVSRS